MAEDKNRPDQSQGEIVIYQAEDGLTRVECRFVDETVWLTRQVTKIVLKTFGNQGFFRNPT